MIHYCLMYLLTYTVYTWKFLQHVNFMDFAVSRAVVKIYSLKIVNRHYLEKVTCERVM